ncbi:DNA primase family protein [Limosilactobacillus oris]|uniref:DNA primase family protein n=1 Tax=Limosilactobacillus oris TaxID=1632 RepID=UPI002658BB66|nr:DNA primase family protein [Limosilactobacillus oris]
MAIKEIPKEFKAAANKRDDAMKEAARKVTPIWLYTDDDDKKKIDVIKFATCVIKDNPMVNNKFSEDGYWYNKKTGYWLTNTDTHLEKIIADSMLSVGKWQPNTFSSVKKLVTIKTTSEADFNPFDHNNPYLVSFKNGTYNMQDGTTKENSAEDYILQGHNYDLDIGGDAPVTNQWFKESFGSKEAANVVKTYIGYMFVRSYQKYQKFMILHGKGGDGKSTILNYLRSLIGANNTSNVDLADLVDRSSGKFLTSKLYQKDLNYFADIGDGFMEQTSILKGLTGGDAITGQFKNKDPFEFINHAKLIFSANSLPVFNDFTDGFIRRPIIVEVHKIKHFDDKFSSKIIQAERGAFAYECMTLFKQLLDDNYPGQLDKWGFPTTDEMKRSLHIWIVNNDLVSRWLDEKCDISDPKAFEKHVYVYDSYKRFCASEGGHPLGKQKFNASLEKHGVNTKAQKKVEGKKYRGYRGIRLLNE